MKTIRVLSGIVTMLFLFQMNAQEMNDRSGVMSAKETYTFAYMDDGVERPFEVTVRERRTTTQKLDEADLDKVNQSRVSTPLNVALLVSVTNPNNASDNRVISLRYEKQINDSFKIDSTPEGFVISVGERKMNFSMGQGISFANPTDERFFQTDEFDIVE